MQGNKMLSWLQSLIGDSPQSATLHMAQLPAYATPTMRYATHEMVPRGTVFTHEHPVYGKWLICHPDDLDELKRDLGILVKLIPLGPEEVERWTKTTS